MLSLFSDFPQMSISVSSFDSSEGVRDLVDQHNFSYFVIGPASLNSNQYVRVKFSDLGGGHDVIAWFNPQSGVDRVDVLGAENHTGGQASLFAQKYLGPLSTIVELSANASMIPTLHQTSTGKVSIGPTQFVVTSYELPAPTGAFTDLTAKFAAIPGTNARLLVFLNDDATDQSGSTIEIRSITA